MSTGTTLAEQLIRDCVVPRVEDVPGLLAGLAEYEAELRAQNDELRAVQAELAQSRDRYQDLYETAPVGYVSLDERGTILESNLSLAALLGLPRERVVGRAFAAFLAADDAERFELHLRGLRRDGGADSFELTAVRSDGGRRRVRCDAVGRTVGGAWQCRAIVTDVDELKQAESAVRALNDELRRLSQRVITSQDDERRRIARELHDGTSQELGAVLADLRALEDQLPDDGARQQTRAVREHVALAVRDVLLIARDLHPSALATCGLSVALTHFLAEQARLHGLEVDTQLDGIGPGERLPPRVELTLFRAVQEAVHNIVKHAGARHVSVVLVKRDNRLRLVVEDDGRGFDLEAPGFVPGLGLISLRERVASIGGALVVESLPGRGTTIALSVPLA